jgi:hypothetical protein
VHGAEWFVLADNTNQSKEGFITVIGGTEHGKFGGERKMGI